MSREGRLYVDVHVIQTLPPSCVNRDDTGSPKTAVYGGAIRARVSSQAWKKAVRDMFRDLFEDEDLGKRTKRVVTMVAEKIQNLGETDDTEKMAEKALENAGLKTKNGQTDALFFMSEAQAEALAELAVKREKDKKLYKAALKDKPSVDMAMFGRMVASDPSLNYDAAVQVAHSISTHAVHNEYDYFTAVDDLSPEDNAGAGHLGTVEFNSATMYRYATIGVCELKKNLGESTAKAVKNFVKAFVLSMPTGKQNTFANRTVPDLVYVTIRSDQPVNLVGAFEKPIRTREEGYTDASEKALAEYAGRMYEMFVGKPLESFVCGYGKNLPSLGQVQPFPEMLEQLENDVNQFLNEERQ